MKIKEVGLMDVQEKKAFEIAFDNKLGARGCQFDLDEDGNYEDRETLCGWHMWIEAKAQADQKIKLLLCDEHLKKCESPTGVFNSQYPDEEPCLICLAKEAKAQAVPDLGELQERIAGHQYYHDEHGHMIVDMDDVVKEISGFDSWKAQAVPDTYTPIVLALEDVQSKIAQASFLTMDADNENEVYAVDANELHEYIAELIEAQEPAND